MKLSQIIRQELENALYISTDSVRDAVRATIENMDLEDMLQESLTNQLESLVKDTVEEIMDEVVEEALDEVDL